jgi:hypothetical protein
MDSNNELCPWCNSVIPRPQFQEIQARIREQEQEKLEALESDLRERYETQLQKVEKRAKEETEKQFARIIAERDERIKNLEFANAQISEQAKADVQKELSYQREILEKDRDNQLLKQEAGFNSERETFKKKIDEMAKQLQEKTSEIVDGGEIDLFEALKESFPEDEISPIQGGKYILHTVRHNGVSCGSLLINSKHRQLWKDEFAMKLRDEQVEMKADHAILPTLAFPRGKKELCIRNDIIVVSPARVTCVIDLLRDSMIRMTQQGLSMTARAGKVDALYNFISSEDYMQRFREVEKISSSLLELDTQEKKEHDKVWKKRGQLTIKQQRILKDLHTEVSAILESHEETGIRLNKGTRLAEKSLPTTH